LKYPSENIFHSPPALIDRLRAIPENAGVNELTVNFLTLVNPGGQTKIII
jgi:hypothetical protein